MREHSSSDRAQRELDRFFDLSLDMLCIAGVDGHFKRINPAFERVLGYTREELLERPFVDFVHPDDKVQTLAELTRLSKGAPTIHFENRYRCKDGTYKWLAWTSTPVVEDGRLYAVARDISEGKRAEQELRDSEKRTRLIVETALDAFLAMDSQGDIIDWNPRAEEIFGWSRDEALGRRLDETVIPERYREIFRMGLTQFLQTGEGRLMHDRFEISALHRDGYEFPVEYTISPIHLKGEYIFSAFVHDISRRKQREEELQRAKEEAERANRAKSDFLANMSHEIRTPMNAIIGLTELVLDSELTPRQREHLTIVERSGESLLMLINGILDFSKIEAGKLDLEAAEFDVRETLGDTLKSLATRAHAKALELTWQCEPNVPETVIGDAGRLRQVLVNLIDNAVKFTEQGEVEVHVGCESSAPGGVALHFSVADTGIGIPSDKADAIFEAFEQADTSTSRRFGGTGLGLSISSRLVELMHGRIWIEHRQPHGTTFHFTAEFGRPAGEPRRVRERHVEPLRGRRGIIGDGNTATLRAISSMLFEWGANVDTFTDPESAIDMLRQAGDSGDAYDFVVCDSALPHAGVQLVRQIGADPQLRRARVVLLISSVNLEDAALCKELDFVSVVTKPVKEAELLDALGVGPVEAGSRGQAGDGSTGKMSGLRPLQILLAEDSPANQKLAVGLLDKHGHSVVVACNGYEALEACESGAFDLILMDVQMPGMDGLEATAAIRRAERGTGRHTPIVAMTAHALAGSREEYLAAGMDGYVAKPVRPQELYRTITSLVTGDAPVVPPPQQSNESTSRLDWDAALESTDGDAQLLKDVVEVFLTQRDDLLRDIERGVQSCDATLLSRPVHTMRGALANFGAARALELAERIREQVMQNDSEAAQATWAEFCAEMESLAAEMVVFVRGPSDDARTT